MTTKLRTLLLLGLTGLGGVLPGCILETTDSPGPYGPGPGSCLDSQYFVVQWEVDNGTGTTALGCSQTPPSHVEVTLNTSIVPLVIPASTCDDRVLYNFQGTSDTQIPVGTTVISASLISDVSGSAGAVLSTAPVPANLQVPIVACSYTLLSFQFPLQ